MTQFAVNVTREIPFQKSHFRVKVDGKVVAGVSKVGALHQKAEVVKHRNGNDMSTSVYAPGPISFSPVTLERGVTYDTVFEAWAQTVWTPTGIGGVSLANYKKDIIIEFLNEQGVVAKSYKLYRCWVSEYEALPELDANGNGIAFEKIVLQIEGLERDTSVTEQKET